MIQTPAPAEAQAPSQLRALPTPAPPDERPVQPTSSLAPRGDGGGNDKADARSHESVYLHGFVPQNDYLRFMATDALGPQDPRALTDRWRDADETRQAMERAEEDWANRRAPLPEGDALQPLPPEMAALVPALKADPIFRRAYSAVPTRIALVELEKLIVYQRTINLDHVRTVQQRLGTTNPAPADLFRFCLPTDHSPAPYRVRPLKDNAFLFISESRDMRYLEPIVLTAGQCEATGYQSLGPVAGVIGAVIGFGSNFMNVIACEQRLVLNNGYHRAYALREMGITHAPCLVQEARSRDDLALVAGARLRNHPDRYLKSVRPPRMADYFHPKLAMRVRLVPTIKQVRVSFTVEELNV